MHKFVRVWSDFCGGESSSRFSPRMAVCACNSGRFHGLHHAASSSGSTGIGSLNSTAISGASCSSQVLSLCFLLISHGLFVG